MTLVELAREGTASIKDMSLLCTMSRAGTCVNKMGLVKREEIDGRSNDTCR